MSLIQTSKYTSQARQQISQKNLRFGLYSSQGIPGKSQLVYCEACFLTLLTDVREGVPWGPGGTGSGEVSESPPPPTEAITMTAASPPSSPRAGKTLWDAPDTLQIHRDLLSIQWIWSALPGNEGTEMNQTREGSLRPRVSESVFAKASGLGNAASNSLTARVSIFLV